MPSGSFAIQQDFDSKYVLTNLNFVKAQLGLSADEYSGAEIALTDPQKELEAKTAIQKGSD